MRRQTSGTRLNQGQIAARRRREKIFVALGIAAVALALLTLAALLIDLAIAGVPRLSLGFLHELPVAAGSAGRHSLGLGRVASRDPRDGRREHSARRRRRHVPGGICPAELGDAHHRDQRHEPRRGAVDRVWPARARPVRLWPGHGPEHPDGRPHAGPADPADHHRCHARGDPGGAVEHPRGRVRHRRHEGAGHARPRAPGRGARRSSPA